MSVRRERSDPPSSFPRDNDDNRATSLRDASAFTYILSGVERCLWRGHTRRGCNLAPNACSQRAAAIGMSSSFSKMDAALAVMKWEERGQTVNRRRTGLDIFWKNLNRNVHRGNMIHDTSYENMIILFYFINFSLNRRKCSDLKSERYSHLTEASIKYDTTQLCQILDLAKIALCVSIENFIFD